MEKEKKKYSSTIIIGTFLLATIIILIIFLSSSKTTISGQYPDVKNNDTLTCKANGVNYPFFTYDNSVEKNIKINVLFVEDNVRSISLIYSLYYNDNSAIVASEAHNHAAMNINFANDGLKPDALGATYSRLDDNMKMSLFLYSSEFTDVSKKYILVDNENVLPKSIEDFRRNYEKQNFECEIINNEEQDEN